MAYARFTTHFFVPTLCSRHTQLDIQLAKSKDLDKYRRMHDMELLFDAALRNELGLGLHLGWAIEGAVGSLHKIEPAYLSHGDFWTF